MEQSAFILHYTELMTFLTEHRCEVIKKVEDITPEYVTQFLDTYKHPRIFTSVDTFTSNNMYRTLIKRNDYRKLSSGDKTKFISIIKKMAKPVDTTNPMGAIEDMFNSQKMNIDTTQIDSAKQMVSKTLGLDSNNPMGNIISEMVSDISGTLNKGIPFKDMIADLSKTFSEKIQSSVDNGSMTKEQLESSTGDLFSKLQNITKNPADLIKTLSGDKGTPVDKEAAKKARREAMKKKWKKEAKKAVADLD